MPHWREMMDSKSPYVAAHDLKGREVVLRISKVVGGVVEDHLKGTKDRKPLIHFEPRPGADKACKPLVCNVTNAKAISAMYGNDVTKWSKKLIAIYPTTTSVGGEVKDCVRVRPNKPSEDSFSKSGADPSEDDSRLDHPPVGE